MSLAEVNRQRAFTGLLRQPVIDREHDPELFALVRHPQQRSALTEWFATRLGYRLVITGAGARLFRLPLGGRVVAPTRSSPPPRRVLVLALLAAAAAEDADDVTSTQDLSDRVRALAQHADVALAPYDPDRFAERQLFVRAVELLVTAGALRPTGRETDEQRENWAHRRDTIGAAFVVERGLLLRMVDPTALAAAMGDGTRDGPEPESAARFGVMRRLVELPVCLHADLTEPERTYLQSQRYRIIGWCTEMTGWTVEQRAEGLALVAPSEEDTDVPFPRLRAVDFGTLLLLDRLLAEAPDRGWCSEEDLVGAALEVRVRHSRAMTQELNTDEAVRDRAVELLVALDLLRPAADGRGWWISPAAARFRNPQLVAVTGRLDEAGT